MEIISKAAKFAVRAYLVILAVCLVVAILGNLIGKLHYDIVDWGAFFGLLFTIGAVYLFVPPFVLGYIWYWVWSKVETTPKLNHSK